MPVSGKLFSPLTPGLSILLMDSGVSLNDVSVMVLSQGSTYRVVRCRAFWNSHPERLPIPSPVNLDSPRAPVGTEWGRGLGVGLYDPGLGTRGVPSLKGL